MVALVDPPVRHRCVSRKKPSASWPRGLVEIKNNGGTGSMVAKRGRDPYLRPPGFRAEKSPGHLHCAQDFLNHQSLSEECLFRISSAI